MTELPINVSSLVIKTSPEQLDNVLCALRASGMCDVFFYDDSGKIIVTIEGRDLGEEMMKVKYIQGLPDVLSADLAYSYCENELDRARNKISDGE